MGNKGEDGFGGNKADDGGWVLVWGVRRVGWECYVMEWGVKSLIWGVLSNEQGLKYRIYRPIFRRYIGYREGTMRFLLKKVVCRKNRGKSANIADISAKYRCLNDISVEKSTREGHARGEKI